MFSFVLLLVAVSETNSWYKGCYKISHDTENTSLPIGFTNPVDCGQTCRSRG